MKPNPEDHDLPDESAVSSQTLLPLQAGGEARLRHWLQPIPVPRPRIRPELTRLDDLERSAEVLRFSLLRAEHWLSPGGLMREWLRRNLRLALAITIPLLLFAPFVSLLLARLADWSAALVEIAGNLAQIPGKLSSGVLIATALCLLVRWLQRR